jgi:alkylhydroperoxidase family enzyme
LAINDEGALDSVLRMSGDDAALSPATRALVRLAAVLALHPTSESLHWAVAVALAAGAADDDVLETLVAAAPIIGLGRVDWVAQELAAALDCQTDGTQGE